MSDEKMRVMIRRMVGMSPTPPEFPDGPPLVARIPRRRHGGLVFAAAALGVFVLALPFILSPGTGRIPAAGDTTTTSEPGSTNPEQTTTTVPHGGEAREGLVAYLVQRPGNSLQGNPTIVPFANVNELGKVFWGQDVPSTALLTWASSGDLGEWFRLPEHFESAVPTGVEVVSESVVPMGGRMVVILEVNQAFLAGGGGLLADLTMLNQFIYTATHTRPDAAVLFRFNGAPIEDYGMEGMSLADPVDRYSFIDDLNPIIVTGVNYTDDGSLQINGKANLFEANLTYQVNGPAALGVPQYTTATCGTGCWGDFEIIVPANRVFNGGEILLWGESGEDGSPINTVWIPVPALARAAG